MKKSALIIINPTAGKEKAATYDKKYNRTDSLTV